MFACPNPVDTAFVGHLSIKTIPTFKNSVIIVYVLAERRER